MRSARRCRAASSARMPPCGRRGRASSRPPISSAPSRSRAAAPLSAICAMPRPPPTACRRMVAAGAKAVIEGPKKKRIIPVEQVPVGPGRTSLAKGEIIDGDPAAEAPAAQRRCLSALHSAHRNGHRRRERRRQSDPRWQRRRHRRPRGARRRGADRACWSPPPPRRSSARKLDDKALEKLAAACSAACRPIDDKRGTIEFRTEGRRRACPPRRKNRVSARRR